MENLIGILPPDSSETTELLLRVLSYLPKEVTFLYHRNVRNVRVFVRILNGFQ